MWYIQDFVQWIRFAGRKAFKIDQKAVSKGVDPDCKEKKLKEAEENIKNSKFKKPQTPFTYFNISLLNSDQHERLVELLYSAFTNSNWQWEIGYRTLELIQKINDDHLKEQSWNKDKKQIKVEWRDKIEKKNF